MRLAPRSAVAIWIWTLAALVSSPRCPGADTAALARAALDVERELLDGRDGEALARALEALRAYPALEGADRARVLPEAWLVLWRLEELIESRGWPDGIDTALEGLARLDARPGPAAAPPEEPLLGAHARRLLARFEETAGRSQERARQTRAPLGLLSRWHIIGPFDNERGSQLLTPLGPEESLDLEAEHRGKKRPVRWRSLPAPSREGEVPLDELLEPHEQALAYALTYVKADARAPATLRLSTDGGYRVWVNGSLVATRDTKRTLGIDQDTVPFDLSAGWNSLLLKLGQTEGPWRFEARLTAPDARPLEGWSEGTPGKDETVSKEALPCSGEPVADPDAGLRARIEGDPAEARAQYLLGALLLARSAHDENEHPDTEALRRAIQIDPTPAASHLDLARSLERAATIAAQKDDNPWRRALEAAEERGSAEASAILAHYYESTFGNHQAAARHVARALERNPSHPGALDTLGDIERGLDYPDARERAARRQELARDRSLQDELAAILGKPEDAGRLGEVLERLSALWERSPPTFRAFHLASPLATRLLRAGDRERALAVADEAIALFALEREPRLAKARLRVAAGDMEGAVESLAAALELAPEAHDVLELRGRWLLRLDRRDEALAIFTSALELQPNLPQLREYVEYLEASGTRFEDAYRLDVAERISAALQAEPGAEGGEPTRSLLDLTATEVRPDGTTKTFVQKVYRVLNDRGVRSSGSFSTYYADGEEVLEFVKGRVWKSDGSRLDAKLTRYTGAHGSGSYRAGAISLPPISTGDVVEVEFVKEDIEQSFFGDYFGHREIFQEAEPVDEKVFILRVPASRQFFFHQRNMDLVPEEERNAEAGTVTYRWVRRDIPRIEPEPAMGDLEEIAPVLEISTFKTWDDFNRWYWSLIRKQYEVSPEITKKVAELTSGAATDEEKIRAIYNFVVSEVRYNAWEFGVHGFKPYNAATIFSRRFGDCKDKATLLCVMLGEVGIGAHPVLIEAKQRRGADDLSLPMVNHFNHCITYVPAAAERAGRFLDGTAQFHSVDELPSMDRGAEVLVVKPEQAELRQVPWNAPIDLSVNEETEVTLDGSLSARVTSRIGVRGDYAVYVRSAFELEAQRKNVLERSYGRLYAGTEVLSSEFSKLGDLDEPVSFSVSLMVPRFATDAPEGVTLRIPEDFFASSQGLGEIISLEERKHAVLLGPPRLSTLRFRCRLPEGLQVRSLPQDQTLESRFGRLTVRFKSEPPSGGEAAAIVLERTLELTAPVIPVAEYPEFREFAATTSRLQDEKIILQRS